MAESYQPAIVGGVETGTGYRECAERFAIVAREVAGRIPSRTPRVLDFGANGGYFTHRLASELGATVTAIDDAPALRRYAKANRLPGVSCIHRRLDAAAIGELPRFDVVLALSVLHHCPEWRDVLTALRGRAGTVCLVETPHPEEPLREAVARDDRPAMLEALARIGREVGTGSGVRSDHRRPIYAIPSGILRGDVFTGSGNCGRFWRPIVDEVSSALGYTPHPGSLNLRLATPLDGPVVRYLGHPAATFWDRRRAKGGKRGGDYQFWRARFGRGPHAIDGHVMVPGVRSHGHDSVELVAPISLRERWGLADGDSLWMRVR